MRGALNTVRLIVLGFLLASCGGGGGGGPTGGDGPGDGGGSYTGGVPIIISFSAEKHTITVGKSTTLTAVFTDGAGSINNGVGAVTSGVPVTVSPTTTTTYRLTVTNGSYSVTSERTITVVPPPVIFSFTADPDTVTLGESTTLTALFEHGTGKVGTTTVSSGSPQQFTPSTPTTYILTVTNAAGDSVTARAPVGLRYVGDFSVAGRLASARYGHSATLLNDGRVLIAGGQHRYDYFSSAEIFDPATGEFSLAGPMSTARTGHQATLLADGRVLITGGRADLNTQLSSAEIFDPETGNFTPVSSMTMTRTEHRAVLLHTGEVLLAGGYSNGPDGYYLRKAEIFDPETETFTATGDMSDRRVGHTLTLLANGKVLVAGGMDNVSTLRTADLYDPATGSFSPVPGDMQVARTAHAAVALDDGSVLLAGGMRQGAHPYGEIYQPGTNSFVAAHDTAFLTSGATATKLNDGRILFAGGNEVLVGISEYAHVMDVAAMQSRRTDWLHLARESHTATRLADGRVLIVGGWNGQRAIAVAELFDPTALSATPFKYAGDTLNYTGGPSVKLQDGRVLITGGVGSPVKPELFDPDSMAFSLAGAMQTPRAGGSHTATVLPNGKVLIAGGADGSDTLDAAELFDPATNTFTLVSTPMSVPRRDHTATLLADGTVLIAGGRDYFGVGNLDTAEIYDPATDSFTPLAGTMTQTRFWHTATLLDNGQVLLVSGTSAELYQPASQTFSATAAPSVNRSHHRATRLLNGKVLFLGGFDGSNYLDTAELYDPATGNFAVTASRPATPRSSHQAVLMPDGKVLLIGGYGSAGYLRNAELYDPAADTFTLVGTLLNRGSGSSAVLLDDGRVLVTGSSQSNKWAELYQ